MTSLDYSWMLERVNRCYVQIWQVSEQVLKLGGNVILDLGITTKIQRKNFSDLAKGLGICSEVHYLNAPKEIRKQRVAQRNEERDPMVFSFEVTEFMFKFMEPKYEIPDQEELEYGLSLV